MKLWNSLMALALMAALILISTCSEDEGQTKCECIDTDCQSGYVCNMELCQCAMACTQDSDCSASQCCTLDYCEDMNCTDLECGPDPVCGKECGTCITGVECVRNKCDGGAACIPRCPDGSECKDLDGICEPECVWPSGKLACTDHSHCPIGGGCYTGSVGRTCDYRDCGCTTDADCNGDFCVNEDGECGVCSSRENLLCNSDSDCVAAIRISRCCALPIPRNKTYVQENQFLVEFPLNGPVPDGLKPDCSCDRDFHDNHCWPLPIEPIVVTCGGGFCRIDPEPGP